MLYRSKSIFFLLILQFLILSNEAYSMEELESGHMLNQRTSILFYDVDQESLDALKRISESVLNIEREEEQSFIIYDINARRHTVSNRTLTAVMSKNYEDPLSVENGQLLPRNGPLFKEGQEVLFSPLLATETGFWPEGTEQPPIKFSSVQVLTELLGAAKDNKFKINIVKVLGSKITATLTPDKNTQILRDKVIAPYSEFYQQAMSKSLPTEVSDVISSIRGADKADVETLVKSNISNLVQILSPEDNFVKEDAASYIIQLFAAISQKGISPYAYGRWFDARQLQDFAKGNGKIVCDYLAYSVPSFMKVVWDWEPHINLMSLKARKEDVIGASIPFADLGRIENSSINQEIIRNLNSGLQENNIFLTFKKAVFNHHNIMNAVEFKGKNY